jgi:hypothetical protein
MAFEMARKSFKLECTLCDKPVRPAKQVAVVCTDFAGASYVHGIVCADCVRAGPYGAADRIAPPETINLANSVRSIREDGWIVPDGIKVEAVARLLKQRAGYNWIVDRCPFCGKQHTHAGGNLSDDPQKFLSARRPHCEGRGLRPDYVLVERRTIQDKPTAKNPFMSLRRFVARVRFERARAQGRNAIQDVVRVES